MTALSHDAGLFELTANGLSSRNMWEIPKITRTAGAYCAGVLVAFCGFLVG